MNEVIKKFIVNNEEVEVTKEEAEKFVELMQEALKDWELTSNLWEDFTI